jgi:hypothetical protein
MIADLLKGTSISEVLTVAGYDEKTECFMLTDGDQKWLLSEKHLDELEASGSVEYNKSKKTLKATWRRAGKDSKFVRGDKPEIRSKISIDEVAARLGL